MPESALDLKGARVLIVDDVPANLDLLCRALEAEGYHVLAASSGQAALRAGAQARPDLILLDVVMPDMDGYEVCRRLKQEEATRRVPVIFLTARDETESRVEGFRAGGVDYVPKPFEEAEVLARVRAHLEISRLNAALAENNRALERRAAELTEANENLRREIARRERADARFHALSRQEAARWGISGFVGQSPTIRKILDEVHRLQDAHTTGVLITGESGTGKELIARALHSGGPRADGPFIPVNCAAIPHDLAESAFFGHVRGAFTGAAADHRGYFEAADGGTLFLDEIGDMPQDLQAKLLRALEGGTILPVGSVRESPVDVRVIAATNADLPAKIARGAFRQDLYFRLAHFTVAVPPLRERAEDIPLMAGHFLRLFAAEMGVPPPPLSAPALAALQTYSFPGNVRELKNMIEHALLKSGGAPVEPEHLPFLDLARAASPPLAPSPPPPTEEDLILAYVRQRGSIGNAECRDLLSVDRRRAAYLLDRLRAAGRLACDGARRWMRYTLPA